jgi:CrcB protein
VEVRLLPFLPMESGCTIAYVAFGFAESRTIRICPDALSAVPRTFPWGTMLVNISGSFVIGFFATLTGPDGRLLVGTTAQQLVMIRLCGGYTIFSSFSLQTFTLAQDGEWLRAGANAGLSLVLFLLAVWLGHILAALLNQTKGVWDHGQSRLLSRSFSALPGLDSRLELSPRTGMGSPKTA